MTRGFFDDADPDQDPYEFESCPEGTWKISGIDHWITKDDDDVPIYDINKNTDEFVARMELERADGERGPAHSATPAELVLLVKAFGGEVSKLPKDTNSTEFLVAVYDQISKSKKEVTAIVNSDGWVKTIKEATPPEGYYRWELDSFYSFDGDEEPHFVEISSFGDKVAEQIMLRFRIVADGFSGKPSPYNGFISKVYFKNPFDGTQDGLPRMVKTKTGGQTIWVKRFYKLVRAYCPDLMEYEDWTQEEAENPIAVFVEKALEQKRSAVAQFAKPERGTIERIQLDSLAPLETDDEDEVEDEEPVEEAYDPNSKFAKERPKLAQLAEYIFNQCPTAFEKTPIASLKDLALTADGKAWAPNLINIMEAAEIEARAAALKDFTEEECGAMLNVIWGGWA